VVNDDAVVESDETITLTLWNSVNAAIGSYNPAQLTIHDNEVDMQLFLPVILKSLPPSPSPTPSPERTPD